MTISNKATANHPSLNKALLKDMVITAIVSVFVTGLLGVLFFTNALVYIIYGDIKPGNIPTAPGWFDIVMVLSLSMIISATVAYLSLKRTFRKSGVFIDGEFWLSMKAAKSHLSLDDIEDSEPTPLPPFSPPADPPAPPVNTAFMDALQAENSLLLSQTAALQSQLTLEQQFNELMLSLLQADDADLANKQQSLLQLFSSYFQADYSALYSADPHFENYLKQLHWDKDQDTARHSSRVEKLPPETYPWTFKQVKNGKPFIFRTGMLDGLLSQFDSAAPDAKSWLQMKLEDTAEYLLCKHENWEHMIILPCIKNDLLQAVLLFGYHPLEMPVQSDLIERVQPAATVLIKSLLKAASDQALPFAIPAPQMFTPAPNTPPESLQSSSAGNMIRINSQPGSGTNVEIYLPPTAAQSPSPGKTHIVILKDEDMLRTLLVRTIQKLDYTVQTTADPDEMISLCDQARMDGNPVSLVILDFNLPGLPDLQPYITKLKAAIPAPKLIASRSYINSDEISAFHNMGFDDTLSKPFHITEFKSILQRSLNF